MGMRRARPCEYCHAAYRPWKRTQRFCSVRCFSEHRSSQAPARVQYAYRGRLSEELWRQIHAAKAEAPTAELYRPGAAI